MTVPEAAPRPALQAVPAPDGLPVLRLLPAPDSAPPYDDERLGASRHPAPPVRLAGALRLVPALPEEPVGPRPRTPLDALPAAEPFARALVQRLLEVLAGVRPLPQLQRHTSGEVYARLERWTAARPRPSGVRPDARAVRSVHVQTAPQGVAEACATVKRQTPTGTRVGALALRLEAREGSWCCTELLGL